jgi:cytochrome c biogenesis protein ResB
MIPAGSLGIEIVGPDGTNAGLDLVSKDSPTVINDLQFTYSGNSFYSSFQVSSDPTNALIWIASGLFILGISLVLYFPHRQVWVLSQSRGMRNSRLLVRANSPRGFNNSAEIESLVKDIKRQLPARNMEQE